jgi:hypothetical protein
MSGSAPTVMKLIDTGWREHLRSQLIVRDGIIHGFSLREDLIEWKLFSAPLLDNLLPHLQTLINFITHTIPKPTLIGE